ncbi:hypothetical protein CBR_g8321 [Chara braunii]|uniref:Uncharacterized protein n=1 Tax=Chara braunii TaxID=69332 RepID=A0A388KM50_CHABU|nr:hypothetical protein CBR_g8321 [Chara braunii]|eukprot:GBG71023.1 hypothetical protein CBR_g8321 [Chara braunii]
MFRTFFLTSVFDSAGTDWVKEDKKVSLDLRLFQGYGVKAFSMKAFDVRGDGTEFRMLSPEGFLSKTNVNRVTGCLPVVDSSFRMSKPLVQFNSPMDLLPGVVKRYREDFSKLPPDQQTDCVFLPFEAGSKSSRQTPSATTGKIKKLPGGPSGANLPSPSVRGGRDLAQGSSEATEFDDRLLHQRNVGRENSQGSAIALDEDNDEDEEGGSAGPHDDSGNEADVEVGDDNMEDQGGLADEDVDTPMHGHDISPAGVVGAAIGQPSTSRGISLLQSRSKGGHDSHAMEGPKARKRTRETSPSASTHKRQARTDAVNEGRGALTASQEARPPRKNSQGGRSGGQGGGRGGGGRGGARKGSQRVRPQELWDSGDEGEGVDPRMPEDADEPVQRVAPIDTTRCFFLEYDDQGFATQDVHALHVDVMRIKRIPRRRILFNHRSLSENIVRSIENAIENSISTNPGAWDRPELVLAPVDRNDIIGGQGRRITPTEFLERDPAEFDWYAVCGQHTIEAMKRLVRKGSPAVKVYGLNAYSKVLPPRVNTECLLDIMRKERYMLRMFNYVLFCAEGRADDEWNDAFFMSYKDLEDRYGPNGLCAAEWEKERDKLHVNKVKMVPRRLGGVEEARQGAGLGPTTTMYKEAPFHLKVFIYTAIDKLDLLHAEVKRIASSARHIVWDKIGKQTTLLPVCMPSKEVLAALDDIVAAAQKMTCRAAIVDIPSSNFSTTWTSHEFDALHTLMTKCCGQNWVLFFFAPQKVQSDVLRHLFRWEDVEVIPGTWKRVDRLPNDITRYGTMATTSRDMMVIVLHVDGGDLKKVTVKPRLHNDLTTVHVVEEKFGNCQGKHGGIEGDDSAGHVHKLGRKRLKMWEYLFRDAPQGRLDGNYIYRKAKVTETLKHYHGALTGAFETFVARCEILKFDLHKDQLMSKDYADLAKSGDDFNPVDSEENSSGFDLELGDGKGGEGPGGGMVRSHDEGTVRSHERPVQVAAPSVGSMVAPMEGTGLPNMGICGPNDEDDIDMPGEASKLAPGDPIPPGYCADPTTIYFLGGKHARTGEDKWGHDILEYSWKFYALRTSPSCGSIDWKVNQTIGTMEGSSSQDAVPLSASPPVPTQAGQREDDGSNVVKTQEVHMTFMPQISVDTTEPSKRMDVSNAMSSDAGATYESLLLTSAALEGISEMQSESGVGLSVPDSQLQSELCTGKGDAQVHLTPQGGAVADGGKGEDVEGILHPCNLETLTDDFNYGGEGGNDVVNTRGV